MAYSQKTITRLSLGFSAFAIIQGALWFLGSIFLLLIRYNYLTLSFEDDGVLDFVCRILSSEGDRSIILFMYVYVLLSFTLCLFSSLIINASVAKSQDGIYSFYMSWSANLILLSIVDIVLTCFLAKDFSDIFYRDNQPKEELIVAYTIAILIAIRGIFIWIINVVCSGYLIVFAFQLAHDVVPRPNNFIGAFEETSGPWHTNLNNNPLAKAARKEKSLIGNSTGNRSYKSLLATESLSISSGIFEPQDDFEARLANIGKPGRRTPLKSPSPVNVPPPMPPPLMSDNSSKEQESIAEMFSDIESTRDSHQKYKSHSNPDYPYIPPPDYSPINSPIAALKSRTKSDKTLDTNTTFF